MARQSRRAAPQMFKDRVGRRLGGRAVRITNPRGYRGHPVGEIIRPPAMLGKTIWLNTYRSP